MDPRHLVWFSCGAASAVTAKLAVAQYTNVEILYCDMSKDEHPDNLRFLADVEQWVGQPIIRLKGEYDSIMDVFRAKRYMSGPRGARCTVEMKKKLRRDYQRPGDVHLFGFTADEANRIKDFNMRNHDLNLRWPLQAVGITKGECFGILKFAGIEIPKLYRLGFKNNNCIGCVKANSPKYWALVRMVAPERFEELCKLSREIGCRLLRIKGKNVFLDELPPGGPDDDVFKFYKRENISCGPECGTDVDAEPEITAMPKQLSTADWLSLL